MIRRLFVSVFTFGLMATGVAAQTPEQVEKGKQVYAAQKCQTCHAVNGVGNKKGVLDDVGGRLSEDAIRSWIVSAPEMTAKTKAARKPVMRSYPNLGKEDLDALVAYMKSLKAKS